MKRTLIIILVQIVILLIQPNLLLAQKGTGHYPYDPLYEAKHMEMVPCAQQIEELLRPVPKLGPEEKAILFDQLVACESGTDGAYAYVARKMEEGKSQIARGNFFLGWDSFLKGHERLDELPAEAPLRQFFLINMGNAYQKTGAMALSIPFYKEALRLHYERKKPIRSNLLNIFTKLSGAYMKLENPDSSLYWSREGVRYCQEFPETKWYASSLNNLGLRFESLDQLDSALYYYQAAWTIQKQSDNPLELYGAVLDNLAGIYLQQEHYDSAYQYYRASFDFGLEHQNKKRMLAGGSKCITTLLEKPGWGPSEMDSARIMMALLDSMIQKNPAITSTENFGYLLRAKVTLEIAEGNLREAQGTFDRFVTFHDSLTDQLNQRRIKALERFLVDSSEKYNDQLTLADLEAQNSKVTLRFFMIIGVLMLIILVFLGILLSRKVRYQKTSLLVKEVQDKLNQVERDNAALKKRELEQELALQKRDVADLALEVRIRSKARKDLIHQLEGVLKTSSPSIQLQVLVNDLKMQADHQQISEVRMGKAEEIKSGFKDRLTQKYPQLTRTDVELCELFLLEIPVKEIASLRKITPESVRMGKYRIRKKLGLTGEEDLRVFLKEI